tara:strand:+ start:320 stop:649 length:330 start_codon:yes stop_codon:yes gene_type:complete
MAEIKPIKSGEALKIDLDMVIFLSESPKNIWIETNEAITAKRRVNTLKEEYIANKLPKAAPIIIGINHSLKTSLSKEPLTRCSTEERMLVGIMINNDVPTATCIIIDWL